MKKYLTLLILMLSIYAQAQVGIGTTSPNSTLDVRGALSLSYRVFTGTTTSISSADNTVVFTGTAASTATLPDATTCPGRIYRIKNASTTSPTPALTIATTSSQTLDGISSWVIDEGNGSVTFVSDGTNWLISSQSVPKSSGGGWVQNGNSVSAVKNLGTTSNYDLPFMTNNTEKMRLTSAGRLGIGNTTPISVLDVNGSVGYPITTTSSNITLDATHYTVIITGSTPTITLPAASSNARRMYVIVNQTNNPLTISTYKDNQGSNSTSVPTQTSITVQSNGTNWYRIQ